MAEDIVPGLQEAIEKDFQNSFQTDSALISIYEKIQNGTATQKDGEAFARELGTVLTDVFHRNVTPEQLPDGRMYYNIANRLIPPALEQNHGLVNEVMRQIITKQNADAGIGLRYQDADLDEDKVHGLVERAANYPQYEVVQNDVETGLTTFTQGVADDAVHKNASFQASAGLHPRIVRETDGDCCKWCLDLAGTYDYESAPPEVYARHANCGCSVEFRPGDGKRQDVWSKVLISDAEFAKIDARKEAEGLPDDSRQEQIGARKQLVDGSMDYHDIKRKDPVELATSKDAVIVDREVIGGPYHIELSQELDMKPRRAHHYEKMISEALNIVGSESDNYPRFVLMDRSDLGRVAGRYSGSGNTLFVKIFDDDAVTKRVLTHELFHWKDYQDALASGLQFSDDDEFVWYQSNLAKSKLDRLGVNETNALIISPYAGSRYAEKRFDETYVEYRVERDLYKRRLKHELGSVDTGIGEEI